MTAFIVSIVYMVIVIGIGWYTSRQNNTTEKYFAAERSVSWPLIGMMLFAFIFAGPAVTGPIESGYAYGIECMWACMGMAIGSAWFILGGVSDLYRVSGRHGAMSVPGVFAFRFDEKVRLMIMVYMTIVFSIFFMLQMTAMASLFGPLLNVGYWPIAILFMLVYIAMAWFGFEGVAWQNVLHNIVMTVGFLLMMLLCVNAAGGWHAMFTELPRDPYWNPWYPSFNISGADLLSAIFQCATSGTIITCAFVAKDRRHTRLGFTFGLILAAIYSLFGPLIGMAARLMYGPDQDPAMIASMVSSEFGTLPGVLLVTAIVAATCSTAPGLLMVVVNCIVNDLIPVVKKDVTDKQKMLYTRIGLFVVAIITLLLSNGALGQLLKYFFLAFAINSVSGVILWIGGFIPKMDAKGALWGLIVGIVAIFIWQFAGNPDKIQAFWFGMLGPLVAIVMSFFNKEPDPKYVAYREELQYLKDNPDAEYREYLEQLEKEKAAAAAAAE
jgi:SSS family solute:Na+ symporter